MAKIIYLMGPSGSGKDSLLTGLKEQLHPESGFMVAHRYITRHWQSGGENHIELSVDEFSLRQKLGLFAMSWEANGHYYGIGCEVDTWLNANHSVIVNGSREHLPEAIEHYGEHLIPVLIEVEENSLRERLVNRGRESSEAIEARIMRSKHYARALSKECRIIHNNGSIDEAVSQLIKLITHVTSESNTFQHV